MKTGGKSKTMGGHTLFVNTWSVKLIYVRNSPSIKTRHMITAAAAGFAIVRL